MTYSELLHQVTFDELLPYIPFYFSFPTDDLPWCKTHYDMLRLLAPRKEDSDHPNIVVSKNKSGGFAALQAFPLEGDLWEASLSREIVVEPEIKATPEEIATCCLWHSSLYGYTKEQRSKTAEQLYGYARNLNDKDLQRIRTKRVMSKLIQQGIHIPSKKALLTIPSFRKDVKESMERIQSEPTEHHGHLRKKRWYSREAIQQEYDRRIGIVGEFAEHCLTPASENYGMTPEAIEQLFLSQHGSKYSYQSYAGDTSQRTHWMLDLIDKYNAFVGKHFENLMMVITVSPDYPFTQDDHRLIGRVSKMAKGQVGYMVNTDNRLGKELRFSVMFYE
ncbi:MAG: hypothetical protein J6X16_01520 [Bacteroidales bacterium]|nr:hypothetical protein [Bacteroidales bacterium]